MYWFIFGSIAFCTVAGKVGVLNEVARKQKAEQVRIIFLYFQEMVPMFSSEEHGE